MAITYTPAKVHWTYFIALEHDFEVLARYVEPVPPNMITFSLEICRILFAAAAECEVVLKQLAARFAPNTERMDIEDLRKVIAPNVADLLSERVFVPRYGLTLDPWANWRANISPDWWRCYNRVKHHRANHFADGNLTNALNSVAALMVATVLLYRLELSDPTRLIQMPDLMERLSPASRLFFLDESRYPVLRRLG